MSEKIIGIGGFCVSISKKDILKTYALGSCVAVSIYDECKIIGGLIHIALPDSLIDEKKSRQNPAYFADTGLDLLLKSMEYHGARKQNFVIKIAGGANVLNAHTSFNIGKRNILAIKKILWRYNLGIIAEDVEGKKSRTVSFHLNTGSLIISSDKQDTVL